MKRFKWIMHLHFIKKIVDLHGVVPEEFEYQQDSSNAKIFEEIEHLAVRKADYLIVVTEAMRKHFIQKYGKVINGQFITLPILPEITTSNKQSISSKREVKPVIIYAGGLQEWQQVPKMVNIIKQTADNYHYKFFCPDPEKIKTFLTEDFIKSHDIEIDEISHSDLIKEYEKSDFGLILREEIVINQVACPTKLVEYLAAGVVPIMDYPHIGDFISLGMKYVDVQNLIEENLPDEKIRIKMVEENYKVLNALKEIHLEGVFDLDQALISSFMFPDWKKIKSYLQHIINRIFPSNKPTGIILRKTWNLLNNSPNKKIYNLRVIKLSQIHPKIVGNNVGNISSLPKCDVLLQVNDFLSGGLENVVLDIAKSLRDEGYHPSILIFGAIGLAAESAIQNDFPVYASQYNAANYENFLRRISPKMVFSHYSIDGSYICSQLNIPIIHMIHNIYMWFTQEQLHKFQKAEKYITRFIMTSEATKQYSVVRLGVPSEKCVILPAGIDTRKIIHLDRSKERSCLRQRLSLSDNDFIFLCVAGINKQKNLIGLVRSFHLALKKCPNANLVLIGPNNEQEIYNDIKKYISTNQLEDHIRYLGELPEAYAYYTMSDAFVCSSFFEGGPLVLLEALAAHLPVVTTNVGFTGLFKNIEGVEIVPPPVNLLKYHGTLQQLHSSSAFEKVFASKLIEVYENPVTPKLPSGLINLMDKKIVYKQYTDYITQFIKEGSFPRQIPKNSWINLLDS